MKKLHDIFASSRFIVPELKARIIKSNWLDEHPKRSRPELSEEMLDIINDAIQYSFKNNVEITLKMYDLHFDKYITGVVEED